MVPAVLKMPVAFNVRCAQRQSPVSSAFNIAHAVFLCLSKGFL